MIANIGLVCALIVIIGTVVMWLMGKLLSMRLFALNMAIAAGIMITGAIANHVSASNTAFAKEHAGHEALHAQIATELATAQRGDIIAVGEEVFVVETIGAHGKHLVVYHNPEDLTQPSGGSSLGVHISYFAEHDTKLIRAGTPEYGEALGKYFAHFYGREK